MTGGRHISHHLSYSWIHKISILKLSFIPGTTEHSGISNAELLASLHDQQGFECIQSTSSFNPNTGVTKYSNKILYDLPEFKWFKNPKADDAGKHPFQNTETLLACDLRILKGNLLIVIFVLIKTQSHQRFHHLNPTIHSHIMAELTPKEF